MNEQLKRRLLYWTISAATGTYVLDAAIQSDPLVEVFSMIVFLIIMGLVYLVAMMPLETPDEP